MSTQEIKVWSNTLINDPVAGNPQRRDIILEEWNEGWLRQYGISAQQMNQLFYLLTSHAAPHDTCPYLFYSNSGANAIPDEALELNGQTITTGDYPEVEAIYGLTLPDITASAPTGFTYIIRKH